MTRLAFLLRGINVGGSGRLPMATLRDIAVEVGMTDPRTYIQSGNLVARWDRQPDEAADALRGAITATVGFTPAVFARTADEMRQVVESSPFVAEGVDPSELHVTFLDTDASAINDDLDIDSFAPERVVPVGHELHFQLPKGIGRSALAAAVARTPTGRSGTTRNWRTVNKIISVLEEMT